MSTNLHKMQDNQIKLEIIGDKTDDMSKFSNMFSGTAGDLNSAMERKNKRMNLIIGIVIAIIVIFMLIELLSN